ncbi:esterase-like activity of phytase family protein [Campylobacter sp. RM16192]|uniref:esterase-like activity of phytase family protein n=1 Tax=Campylobacter sp. RM16192 TaxID=1660080 RepID=UPI0014527B2B|nr:esterase-like activity of phytase family protein [Campylobacter sp. RM16192]QCD52999.1 putative esterase-like protein [Campylobacter sp. RM16192]
MDDVGVNIDCKSSKKILGEEVCSKGKIFPFPNFSPTIYKIKILNDGYEILEKIPLKTSSGKPLTGISNPDTEAAFTLNGSNIKDDVNGLDIEAIVVTKDREFYLADEYGPSIVHVSSDGRVKERWVLKGVAASLSRADTKIVENLPAKLRQRELNRGFESLAISPDENTLYTVLQSPYIGDENSREVVFLAINIKNKKVVGEYIYKTDEWSNFKKDTKKKSRKQNDVKISEMVSLPNGDIVVLERISKSTKFYKVDIKNAKNGEVLSKELVFDTDNFDKFPSKIESLIIISSDEWYLINDNDFGIEGDKTKIIRVNFKP